MIRADILELMEMILERQGKDCALLYDPRATLQDLSFRSLDFSELCLRVEQRLGRELNFQASSLRRIDSVSDLCEFLQETSEASE